MISIKYKNLIINFREGLVCDNCIVCGSETIFESVRFSSCANGHKFPRCCISLLPCDRVPYVVCQNCDAVALTSFGEYPILS